MENKLISIGGKILTNYGLPSTNRNYLNSLLNEIIRETSYNLDYLNDYIKEKEPKLIPDHITVYNNVNDSLNTNSGKAFFLNAPGGTGKTFLINLLLATIRSQNYIAIAVAPSGIASTLLSSGRTAHSQHLLNYL